jgi:hypothetical protein
VNPETRPSECSIIFINYRRTDAGWPADLLADKLKNAFGQNRVFLDVRGIEAGDDFALELESQLREAAVLLVLIGKDWLFTHDKFGRRRLDDEKDWVRREIRTALEREGCRVIPVLLDDAELPNEEEALPEDISALLRRQQVRVRQANSEDDIETLIKMIERSGFQRLAPSSVQPTPREEVRISLTRPKADVVIDLRGQIERGKALLGDLHEVSPSSQWEVEQQSADWHTWRQYSEQVLRQSFSTLEPLQWLKDLRPRHLQFERPWQDRAENLPLDIEQELAFLENLLNRMDHYDELARTT